ncbi:hypothetical protein UF64_13940 [Thalassospira sp. HJ]|uniref:hypothetical protein n=1 Tax=Thalassospira sp. HJ TaxID=1616823 RepID=UPI0005CF1783|nr:hypothetical protein [Thalassospira sp. HJ]KJE34582.1 hypothetical protein UF64_13940 [Thalassospira sp. HJ]
MTQTLGQLIADAQQAYADAAATYQNATIDQKLKSKPELDKAASLLTSLQAKQLDNAKQVDDADVAEMAKLRQQVNDAAALQQGLAKLVSILVKFV